MATTRQRASLHLSSNILVYSIQKQFAGCCTVLSVVTIYLHVKFFLRHYYAAQGRSPPWYIRPTQYIGVFSLVSFPLTLISTFLSILGLFTHVKAPVGSSLTGQELEDWLQNQYRFRCAQIFLGALIWIFIPCAFEGPEEVGQDGGDPRMD
ncbi:hypothetical protein JCM5350_001035 [Sporobolomyces pararoseus]